MTSNPEQSNRRKPEDDVLAPEWAQMSQFLEPPIFSPGRSRLQRRRQALIMREYMTRLSNSS